MKKTFKDKPTLTADDLTLRPLSAEDAQRMIEILSIPEVIFLTGSECSSEDVNKPMSDEDKIKVTAWYASLSEKTDRLDLGIEYKGDLVGELVLNEWDEVMNSCNFRVLMDPAFSNLGIGTRAMKLFIDYAFKDLGLHRIDLEVYAFNPRARRAYEKVGFVHEGTKRESFCFDGKWYDTYVYAMLDRDFREADKN